jgi:hypothetical protein
MPSIVFLLQEPRINLLMVAVKLMMLGSHYWSHYWQEVSNLTTRRGMWANYFDFTVYWHTVITVCSLVSRHAQTFRARFCLLFST